ncbi:hypothetical protein ACIRJR_00250 [Streptomyces sp. NPDC102402]|uniref:hypothetical protein n=1 Tax=Streptomyces sp. NPDC102402 TaxID=3366169 RepID=UPI00382CD533
MTTKLSFDGDRRATVTDDPLHITPRFAGDPVRVTHYTDVVQREQFVADTFGSQHCGRCGPTGAAGLWPQAAGDGVVQTADLYCRMRSGFRTSPERACSTPTAGARMWPAGEQESVRTGRDAHVTIRALEARLQSRGNPSGLHFLPHRRPVTCFRCLIM